MTGKVIDSGANSILLVILPLALIIMVVFTFWPIIVGILVFALGYKLWKRYHLKQLSEQIDPFFNQLIQANQGCLTVIDITTKVNLSVKDARSYLDYKTQQYGAVKRLYEDKGVVYYFLTANALGSIFDDSEPDDDTDLAPDTNASFSDRPTTQVIESQTPTVNPEIVIPVVTEPSTTTVIPSSASTSVDNPLPPPSSPEENTSSSIESNINALNQSELAKRLEVSPTTVAKRKTEADFPLWSQSRDPDGTSWQYVEETKLFIPK
ncbi:hypothetical protein [Geminocystis herdmanii]|uniref:hypothetical protein n=1 Tax=Geminocystis herdmanii TaxID=669359 RepID=UPI00037FBEAA|nr:hypothetical protein [Geminocystis herdmanii]